MLIGRFRWLRRLTLKRIMTKIILRNVFQTYHPVPYHLDVYQMFICVVNAIMNILGEIRQGKNYNTIISSQQRASRSHYELLNLRNIINLFLSFPCTYLHQDIYLSYYYYVVIAGISEFRGVEGENIPTTTQCGLIMQGTFKTVMERSKNRKEKKMLRISQWHLLY